MCNCTKNSIGLKKKSAWYNFKLLLWVGLLSNTEKRIRSTSFPVILRSSLSQVFLLFLLVFGLLCQFSFTFYTLLFPFMYVFSHSPFLRKRVREREREIVRNGRHLLRMNCVQQQRIHTLTLTHCNTLRVYCMFFAIITTVHFATCAPCSKKCH